SASISRTRCPFANPPIAGLQDISPMVSTLWVTSSVSAPMRAAAAAASQPACPPPITMTSNLFMDAQDIDELWRKIGDSLDCFPSIVSRETARLFADTEFPKDDIEQVLDVDTPSDAAERSRRQTNVFRNQLERGGGRRALKGSGALKQGRPMPDTRYRRRV